MKKIEINNLDLLKFCYEKIIGEPLDKSEFPLDECVCFGEFYNDGEPYWSAVVRKIRKEHDCYLEFAMNLRGMFSRSQFEEMARVVFNYIFVQSKLVKCNTNVRISNKKSIRITKAWGFTIEGIKRIGFGHPNPEDMVLFGMLKTECPWI
jgi:RimJ/RimL family protein N-acetyltransferase